MHRTRIDAAFVEALALNPDRPVESVRQLYSVDESDVDFDRLKDAVEQLGVDCGFGRCAGAMARMRPHPSAGAG